MLSSSSSFLCLLLSLIDVFFIVAAAPIGHRNKQFLRLNESLEDALTLAATQRVLMADSSPIVWKNIARQIGDDVELFGEGEIEVKLMDLVLRFGICYKCLGKSKVCYDSKSGFIEGNASKLCSQPSYCGFDVKYFAQGENVRVYQVNDLSVDIPKDQCLPFSMAYPQVDIKPLQSFVSCNPKYVQDGVIKLYSYATPECPMTLNRAKIHFPLVTASPALTPKSSNGDAAASAGFFETPGGIVVIIVLVLCPILCITGLVIFLVAKKTNVFKSKKSAPVESIQWNYDSTIDADECKTAIYNPNFTEFEKDLPSSKKLRAKRAAERKAAAEAKVAERKTAAEKKATAKKAAAEAKAAAKKDAEAKAVAAVEKKVKTEPTQEPTKTEENAKPPTVYDEEAPASPPQKPAPPPPALTLAEKLAPPRRKRKSKHYPRKVPSSEDNHARIYGHGLNKK